MAAPTDEIEVGKFVHINTRFDSANETKVVEPYPRSGHCCATDGINLYVFGGYHPAYCMTETEPEYREVTKKNEVFKDMWCFNLARETWCEVNTVGAVPHETASMSMLLSGHTLLLFGGTCYPWGHTSNADMVSFKLKDKTWSTLACKGQHPPGKYGQAMSLVYDRLYLFGGCRRLSEEDFLFDADLHCLNLKNLTWSLVSDMDAQSDSDAPFRVMYRHSLAWHENKMYLIGNSWRELYSSEYHDQIHVYNLETNTWEKEPTLPCLHNGHPQRRQYHSCMQWKNEVYMCGGHNNVTIFGDIWKLDLPSLQWTRLSTEMPVPTFFHSAAITSTKCLYIFGGVTCLRDRDRTNNIFRIWLDIPPLTDIALRKVLSLLPNRSQDSINRLWDLGVPQTIMDLGTEPHPRSGHCCATDGYNLIVYGGYHPEYHRAEPGHGEVIIENQVFTEMWCFNFATETWHEVETEGDEPTATTGMSMIYIHRPERLLLHGGSGHPWGQNTNGDLIVFELLQKRWTSLRCIGDCPAPKYGQAIIVRQGHLYCYGGCRWLPDTENFLFNSELHHLDLESKEWSMLSNEPENASRVMYKHGLALYEEKLYIVGSSYRDLYSLTHQEKIHVYDLRTREWRSEETLRCPNHGFPRQRKYHGWVQWNNEIYICGGHNNRVVLRDVWKLELPSLQWTRLPTDMPITTYFHSAAITPTKCLYTFGGINDLEDRPRTNAVFRIWLAIPPLLDLALKKVLSLLPNRNPETITRLHQDLGIPANVMDKLRHVE
ncbi:uncharacterized protein LOC110988234 [Acanthaster planci]|uniref:Kelch domain-containing protein 10 n=1 Tax=Acanthaster planci TaxID=133434 RepID=A0A8B7ZNT6_ACAPL|nr:uncharacterized protein LOC110988234 [Acanthaster planci]